MNISEEIKEKNYLIFIKKLNKIGVNTSIMEEKIGDKLKNATFNFTNGGDGTLLNTIIQYLTPNAIKLVENFKHEKMDINMDSLIKVCFLTHISKCEMFKPSKKEGFYEYAPYPYAMKMGLRSIAMCNEFGISLTAEEIEAMTILERENDEQSKFFSSPFTHFFKMANEITFLQLRF